MQTYFFRISFHRISSKRDGEISIRDAAEILQLNFRQTFEVLGKKVSGKVEEEQEIKALRPAKKLAERS